MKNKTNSRSSSGRIQRLVRLLDIAGLKIRNFLAKDSIGYIEKTGEIKIDSDQIIVTGWSVNGLKGDVVAFDFRGKTLKIAGRDTGVVIPENKRPHVSDANVKTDTCLPNKQLSEPGKV